MNLATQYLYDLSAARNPTSGYWIARHRYASKTWYDEEISGQMPQKGEALSAGRLTLLHKRHRSIPSERDHRAFPASWDICAAANRDLPSHQRAVPYSARDLLRRGSQPK